MAASVASLAAVLRDAYMAVEFVRDVEGLIWTPVDTIARLRDAYVRGEIEIEEFEQRITPIIEREWGLASVAGPVEPSPPTEPTLSEMYAYAQEKVRFGGCAPFSEDAVIRLRAIWDAGHG